MLVTLSPSESVPSQLASPSPLPPQRSRTRLLVKAIFSAAAVIFIAECLRIFVGSNFHCVLGGRCYRSGQPSPELLESVQRTHGIRSILNLRDENDDEPWYQREKATAQRLGMLLVNAGLCSAEQPPEDDFWRFVKATRDCPEPVLIHCANGNDRTGLAAAVYLLLRTPTPLAEARQQLSLRYGHFPWGKASCLSRILDSYEKWLTDHHKEHSADHFCDWAEHDYRQEPNPHRQAARKRSLVAR